MGKDSLWGEYFEIGGVSSLLLMTSSSKTLGETDPLVWSGCLVTTPLWLHPLLSLEDDLVQLRTLGLLGGCVKSPLLWYVQLPIIITWEHSTFTRV